MENLSLFGEVEHGKMLDKDLRAGELLDVVRMEFVEADTLRWQDLFSGFDTLRSHYILICHRVCVSIGRYV